MTSDTAGARKVAAAAMIGTTLEWYDFILYGTASALVFNELFFPGLTAAMGTIASFAVFAIGFLARPLGAVFFGHYGDRIGRKPMLIVTVGIMGAATVLIGLLPTANQIGVWAPILLLFLRLCQSFATGGEWGGAALMAVEHAPSHQRGLYGSLVQVGVPLGLVLANGVYLGVLGLMPGEQFLAWGWRVPFLLAAVMLAVGIYIRVRTEESPTFVKFRNEQAGQEPAKAPFLAAMAEKSQRRMLILAIGMKLSQNAIFFLFTVFAFTYLSDTVGMDDEIGLESVILASLLGIVSIPAWAYLSDVVGRRAPMLFGAVASCIFPFIFFTMMDTGNVPLIIVGMVIGLNIVHDSIYGPQASYYAELFNTGVRYTGASVAYHLAAVLSGGFAPLIASVLLAWADGGTWLVSLYFLALGLISTVCIYLAPETRTRSLDDRSDSRVAERSSS
ncbi:MFS transporter [Ornithinimicrobium cavernae]|uniref:MFS transporter n=1 Tax=Ornithinimicrobium cavernae TaxID=2666047 RepID=UPI00192A6C5A|nr:MFS transporter [Ornithinimicrobium cavernae]